MESNKSELSYTALELLKTVQQQKNTTVLREYLDKQDGNIDLVLTQLVLNMHKHFKKISPDDPGLDNSFRILLDVLNCLFYGDPKAKNELDYTIPDQVNLTKEDVLIKYFRLVMVLDKIRHHTNKVF